VYFYLLFYNEFSKIYQLDRFAFRQEVPLNVFVTFVTTNASNFKFVSSFFQGNSIMDMHVPAAVADIRKHAQNLPLSTELVFSFSPQLRARLDVASRSFWSYWTPDPRPCFNPSLLADIRACYDFLSRSEGRIEWGGDDCALEYVVLASGVPGVFNLGGDLDLFRRLIEARDREGLLRYGRACIDVLYRNYAGHDLPITTVSLVQGDCLGGGFEAALSSDVIIAEESARFGFPEILFNLFPGMGAYSFLERKVGHRVAEQIITSGKTYSAEEMREIGVVDIVVENGQGEGAVSSLIKRRQHSRNGLSALATVRRRVQRIEFSELLDVVHVWVESALRLTPRDLKLMNRLVSRQNGLGEPHRVH